MAGPWQHRAVCVEPFLEHVADEVERLAVGAGDDELREPCLRERFERDLGLPRVALDHQCAGALEQEATGPDVQPLLRLDVELFRGRKRLGLLARLRDVLPGQVAIGLTGRDPDGNRLQRGRYRIRLTAVPTTGRPVLRRTIGFRIL